MKPFEVRALIDTARHDAMRGHQDVGSCHNLLALLSVLNPAEIIELCRAWQDKQGTRVHEGVTDLEPETMLKMGDYNG